MGFQHTQFLASTVQVYGCLTCRTHLATNENLISKNFNGSTGRAFLFEEVVNVELGEAEDRHMTTGLHNVRDIFCIRCNLPLGWRYVSQARPSSLHTGALLLGADALPLTSHHATLALGLTGQDKAYVSAEKYKEGKFILERARIVDVE